MGEQLAGILAGPNPPSSPFQRGEDATVQDGSGYSLLGNGFGLLRTWQEITVATQASEGLDLGRRETGGGGYRERSSATRWVSKPLWQTLH